MSSPLRSVTIVGSDGEQIGADNLVGLDESMGDSHVVAAVRCSREDDISLVRALIENDLQPFKHKSSSIVRYGDLDPQQRAERVEALLTDLEEIRVSWGAVVCPSDTGREAKAATTTVAAKKSITNGLATGDVAHQCGDTAILHDGGRQIHDDYDSALRELFPSQFDTSFQRNICTVYLAFLEEADRTYPQTTTADYIAGYICDRLEEGDDPTAEFEFIDQFDQSWIDPGPRPDPVYRLDSFRPVREEALRSRVIAWLQGQGIPQDPSPTGRDPYLDLIDQIDDTVVYEYLRNEI